jgi:hypothetical protein
MSNVWFLAEHESGHYLIEISLGLEENSYKIYGAGIIYLMEVKNENKPKPNTHLR